MKQLVEQAYANGATSREVLELIRNFRAQKKKEQQSQPDAPLEAADSTASTSTINQRLQQEIGGSVGGSALPIYDPYRSQEEQASEVAAQIKSSQFFYDGREISELDADILKTYYDAYNTGVDDYVRSNFDAKRYWEANGWNSNFTNSYSEDELQAWNNQVLEDLLSQAGQDEDGNPVNPYNNRDILDDVLKGVDSEYANSEASGEAERVGRSQDRVFSAAAAGGSPVAAIVGPSIVREIERRSGVDSEQRDEEFRANAEQSFRNRLLSGVRGRMNSQIIPQVTEQIRSLIDEETLADPQAVMELERKLYDEYQIMADLNNSGYIGFDEGEDGERNAFADFGLGIMSEIVKITGTAQVAVQDVVNSAYSFMLGEGTQIPEMYRGAAKELEREIERHRAIALTDPVAKLKEGDLAGSIEDVFADMGHSVPMMAAAIATQRVTGSSRATASVVSAMGSLTAYDLARDEEWFNNLSTVEKGGFIAGYGIAEGAPALVGAKIFERAGKAAASSANVSSYLRGMLLNTPLAMGEEALTEAVTGGAQYVMETLARGEEIDLVAMDNAIQNGFYAGAVMGGTMSGGGSAVSSLGLAASSIPSIQSKLVIKELKRQLDAEPRTSARKEMLGRIMEAVQADTREGKLRRDFYESLRESDPQAHQALVDIQTRIQKLAIDYNRGGNKSRQRAIRNEVNSLVKQRAKLESNFDQQYDLNSRTVTKAILDNTTRVMNEYQGLEALFEGKDAMMVSEENTGDVLQRIEQMVLDKMALRLPFGIGRKSSPSDVINGLRNTVSTVMALSKSREGFKGVVLHKTVGSMMKATNGNVSRGLHVEKAQDGYRIHLLVPAILENTAFHEGYHELALHKLLGNNDMAGLATTLANSLAGDKVLNKFNQYVSRVLQQETVKRQLEEAGVSNPMKAKIEDLMLSPLFAEEFLVEVLADITSGSLDIEVKKGLLESFSDLINRGLSSIPFVGNIPKPAISDLANAIKSLTGQMAEGLSTVDSLKEVKRTAEAMSYGSLAVAVYDETDEKFSDKIEATINDIREATAKEYAEAMALAEERDAVKSTLTGRKLFLQVTVLSEQEAQTILDEGGKLFIMKDNMGGAYLKADGYMGGLFKNPDSQFGRISNPLQDIREQAGGKYFDAFATKLESKYVGNGWKPVSRTPFNEQYAPEGWDAPKSPLLGKPDVVFFVKGDGKVGDGVMTESWDAAAEVARANLDGEVKYQGPLKYLEESMPIEKALSDADMTLEQYEQLREKLKLDETQRQKQNPKIAEQVKALADGNITQQQYIEFVREESPIKPFSGMPKFPSVQEVAASIKKDQIQKGVYKLNKEIPEGYYVGLRLDIPAYDNYDTWVVSVHQGKSGEARNPSLGGKAIAYSQTGYITDVSFWSSPLGAMNIAADNTSKSTIARMFGDWKNHDPEQLRSQAERIMSSPEYNADYKEVGVQSGWIQVGMNPYRHSWFYDKRDGRPVAAASELIQIGALVLAKDTEKVSYSDERFQIKKYFDAAGEIVRFQDPLNDVKLMGEYAQSIKDQTVGGARIGQGMMKAASGKYKKNDLTYDLTLEHVREAAPELYIGSARYFSKMPIVTSQRKIRESVWEGKNAMKYADEVYEIFINGVKDNLLWLHDAFDPTMRSIATLWYDGANIMAQSMASEYGISLEQAAGAIAALSPQMDWYKNMHIARLAMDAIVKNGNSPVTQEMVEYFRKEKPQFAEYLENVVGTPMNELPKGRVRAAAIWAWSKLNRSFDYQIISPDGTMGDYVLTKTGKRAQAAWSSLAMIDKAAEILLNNDIEKISKALGNEHKIRNFYNNIVNPSRGSDATIDTHAIAASHLLPLAGSDYQVKANFGSASPFEKDGVYFSADDIKSIAKKKGVDLSSDGKVSKWALDNGYKRVTVSSANVGISGVYFAYLEAYRRAAAERGLLPREMQSITWEAVRLLYEQRFKQKESNKQQIKDLLYEYGNGKRTRDSFLAEAVKRAGGIAKPSWAGTMEDVIRRVSKEMPDRGAMDRADGALRRQAVMGRGTSGDSGNLEGPEVKSQDSLISLIADFIDKEYSNPVIRRDRRKKIPVWLEQSKGQLAAFIYAKDDILNLLQEMGMDKKAAEETYRMAYQYKKGRIIGKKETIKAYKGIRRQVRKLSTESENLKKRLELLRDKSQTYNTFLGEAIELIREHMKELGKVPFSTRQLTDLVRIVRMAHKVSPKRIEKEGYEVMQTFIDKVSNLLDEQDSKKAMADYLNQLNRIKGLQGRLSRQAKTSQKGEALKSTATYNKYAESLSKINAALLERDDVNTLEQVIERTIDSMKKPEVVNTEDGRSAVSYPKLPAQTLAVLLADLQTKEEVGREAYFIARAESRALRNKTTIEEEYAKIKKAYERSKLNTNRRNILRYIEEWNENNKDNPLDSTNPAHIEMVLQALYQEKVGKEDANAEMIVDDVLLPRIAANIDQLLEEPMIAEILGVFDAEKLELGKLRERLLRLTRRQIAHLDYKLDDYLVNDSVFGIGYVHSLVRGAIDYADELSTLQDSGVNARNKVYMSFTDTVDSFIRNVFPTTDMNIARIRRAIGFGSIEGAFGRADFRHAAIVEDIESKVLELEKKSGRKITTVYDKAVMQLFSMSRQPAMDQAETEPGQNEAEWYVNLKGVFARTIEYHRSQEVTAGGAYSKAEIDEMQKAYDFLFSDTNSLADIQEKVKTQRPELVEMVDYMVDVHMGLVPQFSNYVERYLGKELVMEDNYTPFDVRIHTKNSAVNETMRMYEGFHQALQESSLAQTKKAAGSSFERNPRSISGDRSIIGLNFLGINESTLRENVILMETVGSTLAHRFVMNSNAAKELIPNDTVKKELEAKIARYVRQDTGKVPAFFQKDFVLMGRRVENPAHIIRQAVVVNAFGGFIIQTFKQSNVLANALFQSKNPLRTFPYVMQTIAEMVYFSGKGLFRADSKIALDKDGRYKLLQNSPVFNRDYESGSIDPFTGAMNFDSSNFQKIVDYGTKLSIKNLKGTDKVVAIGSWFGFYVDSLIEQGLINSPGEVDWNQEAVTPNKLALSYADSLVTKDQAASTPRQAADLYAGGSGFSDVFTFAMQNLLLPFSRFAVNKKRSIVSDIKKVMYGDKQVKLEGSRALAGSIVELATFHAMGKVLIPMLANLIYDDEEDKITSEQMDKAWVNVAVSTAVDFLPQIPLGMIDDSIRYLINKYVVFPFYESDNFGIGDETFEERFERWNKVKGGAPIYGSNKSKASPVMNMFAYLGPYGDFINSQTVNIENAINLGQGGNKVVGSTGREYYIRPEDKQDMTMYYLMNVVMGGANIFGFGNKEAQLLMKQMDNTPVNRSLSSEEELAAYETLLMSMGATDDKLKLLLEDIQTTGGTARLSRIMSEVYDDPMLAEASATKFGKGMDAGAAEMMLKRINPDLYRKHIFELRNIARRVSSSRDYYVLMRAKAKDMPSDEFKEFSAIAQQFFAMTAPSKIETSIYLESIDE